MHFTKRQKFILLSGFLTLSLWFLPKIFTTVPAVTLTFLLIFLATIIALGYNFCFPEHLIFPIYPALLTLAFFLNTHHFALYFFVIYLLFLTLNILNVATTRTVPLKQAALSTFYFLGLLIGFFNIKGILALHPSIFQILPPPARAGVFSFLLSFALALPLIYAVQIRPSPIEEGIGPKPKLMLPEIVVISLLLAEAALAASFFKLSPIILAVFLTGILFLMIGLLQHCVKKTLTKRILLEHIMAVIGLAVFFTVISR